MLSAQVHEAAVVAETENHENYTYGGEVGRGHSRKRVVCLSDTHGKHTSIHIPPGDILIFAGNFSNRLRDREALPTLDDFNAFLGTLPHKHKVVVAGSHEVALSDIDPANIQSHLSNATYLQDSAVVLDGMKIYGSPWTASYGMGFYAAFEELAVHFRKIPRDTNIVVTHCPPFGIMDYAHTRCGGFHWGSESLRTRVQKVRPIVHVFGHCVDEQGFYFEDNTLFVNSAAANTLKATVFDMLDDDQYRVRLSTVHSMDFALESPPLQRTEHRRSSSDMANCRQS